MGKKDKNKKKGKGAEKTAARTEKKLSNKQKKELAALGEDDIETILAQIEKEDKKRLQVTETKVGPPSRRINFSFVVHPDKEELILFGGEYFNGSKTDIFNDLFFYNISNATWTITKAPNGPPPRCGHQMVTTSANKGQLWVFGGEFASPTQNQFYHYRDLWIYHLAKKQWEKVNAPNGPSARSGHRMVFVKKQIVVFGGFHDNLREYRYFNDVHCFNTETYQWVKLEPSGTGPAPRSGCCMVPLTDGKILIYGGYSKERIKKDVDKGNVFTDAFLLGPEKNDESGTKWKWQQVKMGGSSVSARCSMPMVVAPNNMAYSFGGVLDEEDEGEEEDLSGTFFNDFLQLDLDKRSWRKIVPMPRREKDKTKTTEDSGDTEENTMEVDEPKEVVVADDGVFTVTVGPAPVSNRTDPATKVEENAVFVPSGRMNSGLAVKHGVLYLYGGMVEDGDKQLALCDFYSLDLHKLNEWKTLLVDDKQQEWLESDSGSESDGESGSGEESGDDEESDMDTD